MRTVLLGLLIVILTSCNRDVDFVEERNNRGVEWMDQRQWKLAQKVLEEARTRPLADSALHCALHRNLSRVYQALHQMDSAKSTADRAHVYAPVDSYYYWLTKGELALLNNQCEDAETYLLQAAQKDQSEMIAYNLLGVLYSGKYDEEWLDYQKSLKYNKMAYETAPRPALAEALAVSYMNVGEYANSLPLWREVRAHQPQEPIHAFREGVALYNAGEKEKGKSQMQATLAQCEPCRDWFNQMNIQ